MAIYSGSQFEAAGRADHHPPFTHEQGYAKAVCNGVGISLGRTFEPKNKR